MGILEHFNQLEEDLCCPVCHEVFKYPVILSCTHSFCRDCLQRYWRQKQERECPVCRKISSKSKPPLNRVLKNLCESFLQERDQRASEVQTHSNHRFRPIDEAAKQCKKELQETLEPVKKKLKVFKQVKVNCNQTAEHLKAQARCTKSQIKKQFKKLHQFLDEEEEARVAKMEALSREIAALSDTVRATEEQLRAEDVSFLINYKAAVERVQQRPLQISPDQR
uniref:RING-type domain-containing protein n=1 Tax=Sander lucioperca TaxID=283035 RepID=A0A8D0AHU2_SANLU